MDTIINDSGTRVTRSLRKRLTSIDSENSRNPGTPVSSKLTAISEISASPSRPPRMTRRISISEDATPLKTPVKKIASTTVTPARRSTRRHSVSAYDNEDTPQKVLKMSLTGLQSKSPPQIKTMKTSPQLTKSSDEHKNKELELKYDEKTNKSRNSGSKFETQEHEEKLQYDSEVEIVVYGNEIENIKNILPKVTTIVLTDDETSNVEENEKMSHDKFKSGLDTIVVDSIKSRKLAENEALNNTEKQLVDKNMIVSEIQDVNNESLKFQEIDSCPYNSNARILNASTNVDKLNIHTDTNEHSEQDVGSQDKNVREVTLAPFQTEIIDIADSVGNIQHKVNLNVQDSTDTHIELKDNTTLDTDTLNVQDSIKLELEDEVEILQQNEMNSSLNVQDSIKLELEDEVGILQQNEMNSSLNVQDSKKLQIEDEVGILQQNEMNSSLNVQDSIKLKLEDEVGILQQNEMNSSLTRVVKLKMDSNGKSTNYGRDCTESQVKEKSSVCEKIDIISVRILNPYCENYNNEKEDSNVQNKMLTKKVDFVSSPSNDIAIKNVYPKTPVSVKTSTNSFKEINSSQKNVDSFQAENDTISSKQINIDKQLEPFEHIDSQMTPICDRILETIQASTTIDVSNHETENIVVQDKYNHETEPDFNNKAVAKDDDEYSSLSKDETTIKWINPSVKGTTEEGSKLDAVGSTRTINNCNEYAEQQVAKNKKKSIIFSSEDEEEIVDITTEREEIKDNYEFECELAPGEKPYIRKHDFLDDEAMEVDNYESGDSMDSEERREMEENEIPIDGESIGSHTTENEYDECYEEVYTDNDDLFIDNEEEEVDDCSESNEEQLDEGDNHERKLKKNRRLQYIIDSSTSSSADEEVENLNRENSYSNVNKIEIEEGPKDNNTSQAEKCKSEEEMKSVLQSLSKSSENIMLDSSKLSDSALRLQGTAKSESDEETQKVVNKEIMNNSRKHILRNLNQSDRFNKSLRDLNLEIDTSFDKGDTYEQLNSAVGETSKKKSNSVRKLHSESPLGNVSETLESNERNQSANEKHSSSRKLQSESLLGEISVTSESDGISNEKHNSCANLQSQSHLGKVSATPERKKQDWQRSFTIDETVKDGGLEAAVTDVKLQYSPSPSRDERKNGKFTGEEGIQYLYVRSIPLPLANPLIRTRRQSLALPTNPDMEICSSLNGTGSSGGVKQLKRKSLGISSSSEFNPSQSFIDDIELHRSELIHRHTEKHNRLSKSFCGASKTLDNSIVNNDVQNLHKCSKLLDQNSIAENHHHDAIENVNSSKLSTKNSSTPHQKTIDKSNTQHILSRCDEILEAANRAKLEAKLNKKNNQGKISNKLRVLKKKCTTLTASTNDANSDEVLRRVSLKRKRKDISKKISPHAIKAANVTLGKNKHTSSQQKMMEEKVQPEPKKVLKTIENAASIMKYKKETRETHEKMKTISTICTSAVKFIELPQTPEKQKKKPIIIQLPTGKVSVEPITPQRRSVFAFNGSEFKESRITPCPAGFKVRQIPLIESSNASCSSSSVLKNGKRKRHHQDDIPIRKKRSLQKSQWTKSGIFIEEEIPNNHRVTHCRSGIQIIKKQAHLAERKDQNIIDRNFKENVIMRPYIKRGSKREMMM